MSPIGGAPALDAATIARLRDGFHPDPQRSLPLPAECYLDPVYASVEASAVFARSWQFAAHSESLRSVGDYVTAEIGGVGIVVVRSDDETLRAFYNVCRHRGHELLTDRGNTRAIVCPYHSWTYRLDGGLASVRRSDQLVGFDTNDLCLRSVQVEEFVSLIFVNLDADAPSLAEHSGTLADEINRHAPDIGELTHAHRLTYRIQANWKAVIDNFLECYHCAVAHRDFVSLVDMSTYKVTTSDIWSSHMARAGQRANTAYAVTEATVTDHAVWWLWPNQALMRYPGRPNFMVWRMIPAGPEETLEIFDFWFESGDLTAAEVEAIAYIDDVLQPEDIALVESVQRGMRSPGFDRGRYMIDRDLHEGHGSGLSEHAVHHFHGLVLDAYQSATDRAARSQRAASRSART